VLVPGHTATTTGHTHAVAAHTVLVLSRFCDAARWMLGKRFTASKMTDPEKVAVTIGVRTPDEGLIRNLYDAAIPFRRTGVSSWKPGCDPCAD
jgi:hypothetical protein